MFFVLVIPVLLLLWIAANFLINGSRFMAAFMAVVALAVVVIGIERPDLIFKLLPKTAVEKKAEELGVSLTAPCPYPEIGETCIYPGMPLDGAQLTKALANASPCESRKIRDSISAGELATVSSIVNAELECSQESASKQVMDARNRLKEEQLSVIWKAKTP